MGHGESEGLRGHVKDYHTYVQDVWQHVDLVREKYPDVPLFLFGHSMVCQLSRLYCMTKPPIKKNFKIAGWRLGSYGSL